MLTSLVQVLSGTLNAHTIISKPIFLSRFYFLFLLCFLCLPFLYPLFSDGENGGSHRSCHSGVRRSSSPIRHCSVSEKNAPECICFFLGALQPSLSSLAWVSVCPGCFSRLNSSRSFSLFSIPLTVSVHTMAVTARYKADSFQTNLVEWSERLTSRRSDGLGAVATLQCPRFLHILLFLSV